MKVLALETSQDPGSIAVRVDGRTVAHRVDTQGRGQAERLLPLIAEILAGAGLRYRDVDVLAVGIGPGMFTGVRVGIAAVRGLRAVLKVPALGVGTLHAIAAGAAAAGVVAPGEEIYVVNDARNDEAYAQAFGPGVVAAGPPRLLAYADAVAATPRGAAVLGTATNLFATVPGARVVVGCTHADAAVVAALAEAQASASGFRDPGPPRPQYVRPPHARAMDVAP